MKTKDRDANAMIRLWIRMLALVFCMLMLAGCGDTGKMLKQEDLPGGRRDWSNPDAPKAIVSKELISFEYEGAVLDYEVCHFSLVRQDDGALCTGWGNGWYGDFFDIEFMAKLSSLDALQAVIDEYSLAQFNGLDIIVNGLPPYCGELLHAKYASGEKIYAADNQSPFISGDARLTLFNFFSALANEAGSGFYTEVDAEAYENPYEGIEQNIPPITWEVEEDSMRNSQTFVFNRLPQTVEDLKSLATLATPYQTAALTVAALCRYGEDTQAAIDMLNYLKGPQALSTYEIQFLKDRLSGKAYKPFSFFEGATPENDYTPTEPFKITVFDSPYSFQEAGYAKLLIRSSGADNPREIKLREKGSDGQWFLWENLLLSDIRQPEAADPWA